MKKRILLWSLPFLLGLGVAYRVTQPQSVSEGSGPAVVTPTTIPSTISSVAAAGTSVAEATASEFDGDETGLSELSSIARPLGSAFPEEVLDGLGDPIGSQPTAISIGDIGVRSASIDSVGITADGELDVPDASSVGWYQFGAGVDGGGGSTVLAAHIAFNGRDGVFRDLADVAPGAEVVIERDGEPITYRVTEIVQYSKEGLPIADLFREDGPERLVLITCGGSFNTQIRSYDDNVVAIAERV